MEFAPFDTRRYRTLAVREGYAAWVETYESTVFDEMDLRLLARIGSVAWKDVRQAVDLACGTGRIGAWLAAAGVQAIDGVDVTEAMLERARAKDVYRELVVGDMRRTELVACRYDLAIQVLAEEHIPDLGPLYDEAARLAVAGAAFVIVGYHPYFLLSGVPTHFDDARGEPVAIESYVHLFSDHFRAARAAGFHLAELDEGLVDGTWIARKPKWEAYRNRPVSYAMVWRRP